MKKIMILSDSNANPRSFPKKDITFLEDTYPYQLREKFDKSIFWQLSFGDITSNSLCSQAIGYLHNWDPEVIVVHSGMADCRPEINPPFVRAVLYILKKLRRIYRFNKIEQLMHRSIFLDNKKSRVTKEEFRRFLKRFKNVFTNSHIYWVEICADDGYEAHRPGYNDRAIEYNKIIKDVFGDNMLLVREPIKRVDGFNSDTLHWNKNAHDVVSNIIINKISNDFNLKEIDNG